MKKIYQSMLTLSAGTLVAANAAERPTIRNVLLFTADDLGYEAVGCFGCPVPQTTPNLDGFAKTALRFTRAHVQSAICVPSRGILATGLFGFQSGVYGFFKCKPGTPTIMRYLQQRGYYTGILGKVDHSTPDPTFKWDFVHDYAELGAGRSPSLYYKYAKTFLEEAKKRNRRFYFMVNSHDPHRPFFVPTAKRKGGEEKPSKIFSPAEVKVPGWLPDLPLIREEVSYFFNSVRRLDDTFGKVMQALRESGLEDETLVIFLGDNGTAIPFAKANAYPYSTRTPLIVRWPGVTPANAVNDRDYIAEVDLLPTMLEALGEPTGPFKPSGRSIIPLLRGRQQDDRDFVVTLIDYKNARAPVPMRCIQNKRYAYIFNAWSNGKFKYKNNNEGLTADAMESAAQLDPAVAARLKMYRYRVVEELYDLEKDPNCLKNLVDDPDYEVVYNDLTRKLEDWMKNQNDPLLNSFLNRKDPQKLAAANEEYKKAMPFRKNKDKQKKAKQPRSHRRKAQAMTH